LVHALNEKNRERFDKCYAEEITVHGRDGYRTLTHESHWQEVQSTFNLFPDYSEEILGIIAQGDRVYLYWTSTGTHLGRSKSGLEPTGTRAEWWGFSDYRLENGRVVEAWQIHDSFDLYEQLGWIEMSGS
jgi:predicted ester cyclase